jgi:hypothetical protein
MIGFLRVAMVGSMVAPRDRFVSVRLGGFDTIVYCSLLIEERNDDENLSVVKNGL